jgi:phosphonate transport system substrate-binding protein
MRTKLIALILAAAVLSSFQTSCHRRKGPVGTKTNPIRFFFMPLKGDEVFKKEAPVIKKYLEEKTGLTIEPVNAPDFITIINAFGNKQADIAFMNTLGYLMARDWAKTEAALVSIYSDVYRDYQGEILAQVGGKINSLADLNGKTVAFADPFSASGYLYALKLFQDNNIKPAKTVFAGGHKKAVEMVYKGQVDAAATYHSRPSASGAEQDARAELLKTYPDIFAKLKIVALTDQIPNGPVALRFDLPVQDKLKLIDALRSFAETMEGRQTLADLYNMTGFQPTTDAAYNPVEEVIKKLGKSVEETVPGGITFYRTKIGPLLSN